MEMDITNHSSERAVMMEMTVQMMAVLRVVKSSTAWASPVLRTKRVDNQFAGEHERQSDDSNKSYLY